MIQVQTKLKVIDNSGVKKGQAIKIYQGKSGKIGDIILISVKQVQSKSKINILKGNLYKALIVRTKYKNKGIDSNYTSFDENSIVLLKNQNLPVASRILGPVPLQLRKNKQLKIISLASYII